MKKIYTIFCKTKNIKICFAETRGGGVKSVSGLKLSLVSGYTIGIWDQLLWKWRQNPPCFGDTFLPANNMEHFLQ